MSVLHYISEPVAEDKEKLEQDFLAFLREVGYPDDSIFRGPSFHLKQNGQWRRNFDETSTSEPVPCYADLAILDLETSQYAGLVEFRLQADEKIEAKLAGLFLGIFESTESRPPVFLVVPRNNAGFRIHQLREDGNWQELPQKQFPRYPTLTTELAAETALARKIMETRELDRFAATCYALAAVLGLIVIANILGWTLLTPMQLSLLILVVLLFVAPHAIGLRLSSSKHRPGPPKRSWLLRHAHLPLFGRH